MPYLRGKGPVVLMSVTLALALTACDFPDAGDDAGESEATASGGTSMASTGSDATGSDESSEETTGVDPSSCQAPQEIPAAPVDCSEASGVLDSSVLIEDMGDDPSILEGVVQVNGSVRINRTALTNLDFMACVTTVTGDVTIFGNDSLTNVDGLWSLTEIGTDFIFSENGAITDFDGLPNIAAIEQNLIMKNNDSMTGISGLHSLVGIEGNLTIQTNPVLTHVDGLGGLALVGGVLAITANPSLCISSVDCVGEGISVPAVPPESWSTQANDNSC